MRWYLLLCNGVVSLSPFCLVYYIGTQTGVRDKMFWGRETVMGSIENFRQHIIPTKLEVEDSLILFYIPDPGQIRIIYRNESDRIRTFESSVLGVLL